MACHLWFSRTARKTCIILGQRSTNRPEAPTNYKTKHCGGRGSNVMLECSKLVTCLLLIRLLPPSSRRAPTSTHSCSARRPRTYVFLNDN